MKMENKKLDNHIIITDDEGVEHRYEILFTYDNEDRGVSYVLFYDENTPQEIMAMRYDEQGNLYELESDAEWDEVEEVLNTFSDDEECECGCDEHDHEHDCECHHCRGDKKN